MSTRCNVVLKERGQPDIWLYHHSDGYPDGVGTDLLVLVRNLNDGWHWPSHRDDLESLASWMCNDGIPSQWGIDNAYELTSGEHWDVEYLYTITRTKDLSSRDGNYEYMLKCEAADYGDPRVVKEWEVRMDDVRSDPLDGERRYHIELHNSFTKAELDAMGYSDNPFHPLSELKYGQSGLRGEIGGAPAYVTRTYSRKPRTARRRF